MQLLLVVLAPVPDVFSSEAFKNDFNSISASNAKLLSSTHTSLRISGCLAVLTTFVARSTRKDVVIKPQGLLFCEAQLHNKYAYDQQAWGFCSCRSELRIDLQCSGEHLAVN